MAALLDRYRLNRELQPDLKAVVEIFGDPVKYVDNVGDGRDFSEALKKAQKDGFAATTPWILNGRSLSQFNNPIWQLSYVANSADLVGLDSDGQFAKKGEWVVITEHNGLLSSPERLIQEYERAYSGKEDKDLAGIPKNSFRIDYTEIDDLLHGGLPGGRTIKVYSFRDFLEESKARDFLRNNESFAVVRRYRQAAKEHSGFYNIEDEGSKLWVTQGRPASGVEVDMPSQLIVHAGGVKRAVKYLERQGQFNDGISIIHPYSGDPMNPYGQLAFITGKETELPNGLIIGGEKVPNVHFLKAGPLLFSRQNLEQIVRTLNQT